MLKLHASVPSGLCVALFKGHRPGMAGVYADLGRLLDRGPYSHLEIKTTFGLSLSSSFMDHGVRGKLIQYSSVGNWDFIPIHDESGAIEADVWKYFYEHNGEHYDITGNIRFACGFVAECKTKQFCSEFGMGALGYAQPWRYGPNGAAIELARQFKTTILETTKP